MAQQSVVDIAKAPTLSYNEKDWDGARKTLASGVVYDELGTQRKIQGVDGVLEAWRGWAAAMPDSKATFDKAVATGNTVVLEITWRGTHKGTLKMPDQEIAPTGKKFEVRACQVVEVANDKVQSVHHYFDMATLLRQLGVEH